MPTSNRNTPVKKSRERVKFKFLGFSIECEEITTNAIVVIMAILVFILLLVVLLPNIVLLRWFSG